MDDLQKVSFFTELSKIKESDFLIENIHDDLKMKSDTEEMPENPVV